VLMFSLVLGIFLHTPDRKRKIQLLGLMGVIFVPFIFTESRSSYLSFVAAMGLFIFYSERKRLLIGATLLSLFLAPVLLPQNVISRIMYTFNQAEESGQLQVGGVKLDTSTSERLKSWQNVLTKRFPQHPILGVGVTGGGFLDAQYPRILLETGIVGLLLFLWLMRRIWVLLRQCYGEIRDPVFRGVALGAICGFGGLIVHGIGANTFIIVRIMEPLMIVLGLLFAALMLERQNEKSEDSVDEHLQSDSAP